MRGRAEGLQHRGGCLAGGNEHHQRRRLGVLDALHVGGEIRIDQRHADAVDDGPAAVLEAFGESLLGVMARAEIADQRVRRLERLRGSLAERVARLPKRERHPHQIGRTGGDDRIPAFMMTNGTFASAVSGAIARALGVTITPARKSTLSRTTSSCASRLATSGLGPVSSRTRVSIVTPGGRSFSCCWR
jgi:hypothetical protein